MFGFHYLKASPTQYVIQYRRGRAVRSGTGLAFIYFRPTSIISVVPVGSADVPFIFNEITQDYQPVTVQGQLTFRVTNPELVASLLDYSVDGSVDNYRSDDREKLPQRLINLAQNLTRTEVLARPMREAIRQAEAVADAVMTNLAGGDSLAPLGVEIIAFAIQAIRPTPEISRALEAEAREGLLRQADDAIYERRNSAVEQERRIKENELNTEIAVETKQRQIRETRADADMAVELKDQSLRETQLAGQVKLEEERKTLVAAQQENIRTEAEARAYALKANLDVLGGLKSEVLQLLAVQSADPARMTAMALRDLAGNADKIGTLMITPELLDSLINRENQQ